MVQLPNRKCLSHGFPQWVDQDDQWFVTIVCRNRHANSLANPSVYAELMKTFLVYESRRLMKLTAFTLMPDHLHLIARWNHGVGLRSVVRRLKSWLSKTHQIKWQSGFFDHRLRSSSQFLAKVDYIRQNPVRKGLVSRAEDWPFSWITPSA